MRTSLGIRRLGNMLLGGFALIALVLRPGVMLASLGVAIALKSE